MFGSSLLAPLFRRRGHVAALTGAALSLVTVSSAQAITTYEIEVLRDNPLYYWTFNEASGNASSRVNNIAANQLAPQGAATRVSHGSVGSGLTLGNAADFNGVNGTRFYTPDLDGANLDFVPTQHWALEFWFQVQGSTAGSRGDYLHEGNGAGGANNPGIIYDFGAGGDNKIELFSPAGRSAAQGVTLNDNNWHHAVMAFYGNDQGFGLAGRQDIYIDGALAASITGSNFSSGFALVEQGWGATAIAGGLNAFQGRMDEIAIYDIGSMVTGDPQNAGNRNNPALIAQMQSIVQGIAAHATAGAAGESSKFIVTPVGYNYTGGVQPFAGANRDDPTLTKLTDGIIARTNTGANLGDNTTVGFQDPFGFNGDNGQPHPQVTFNLGGSFNVDEVWIDYIGSGGFAGVEAPDRVDVLFSTDGVNFAGLQSFTNFNDALDTSGGQGLFASRRLAIDLLNTNASFLQLRFFNNQEWTFLSEVTIVAATNAIPEPANLTLLGVAGLLMARRRRAVQ